MRTPIPDAIRSKLRSLRYTEPLFVLHEFPLDDGYFIRVIGDPDNGAYEWTIERPKPTETYMRPEFEHSDCGYGQTETALRDGLIAYFGLPDGLLSACESALLSLQSQCENAEHRKDERKLKCIEPVRDRLRDELAKVKGDA